GTGADSSAGTDPARHRRRPRPPGARTNRPISLERLAPVASSDGVRIAGRAGTSRPVGCTAPPGHNRPPERAVEAPQLAGSPTDMKVSPVSTYAPKPGDVTRAWYVIDATDVVLGRLAVQAATLLRGKHKPQFAPNADCG